MSKNIPIVSLLLISFLLTGCAAKQLSVTYNSDPSGATVLAHDGRNWGRTPTTLYYTLTDEEIKRGKTSVQGVSVKWASGATASVKELTNDLTTGLNKSFSFKRPANVPGLDTDMRFALELERLELVRRQTAAIEDAAYEAKRARRAAEDAKNAAEEARIAASRSKTCRQIGKILDCD
jgi:hypothetical protein